MQYLNRSRLPVFTPRLDLTAEDLNAQAETLCAAINELAGRLHIIKDMIPLEERSQYAEELNYPILDELARIWEDIQRAWETIAQNKEECEEHYQDTLDRISELDDRLNNLIQEIRTELLTMINTVDSEHDAEEARIENKFDTEMSDLETRFNALDDAAARKTELAALLDRINYIQNNSIPHIGADGYWYIGNIKTDTRAQGDSTLYYTKNEVYNKVEVDQKIHDLGTIQRLCGRVDTYQDLPANPEPGDTWLVGLAADPNKSEYIWVGSSWEELGPTVDLTNYYTKSQTDSEIAGAISTSEASTLAGYTAADAANLQAAKNYTDSQISGIPLGAKVWTGTEQQYLADKTNIDATYDIVVVTGGN